MENANKTVLYDQHKQLGGKIVDFNGWALPVQYTGIIEEVNSVRNSAGILMYLIWEKSP